MTAYVSAPLPVRRKRSIAWVQCAPEELVGVIAALLGARRLPGSVRVRGVLGVPVPRDRFVLWIG